MQTSTAAARSLVPPRLTGSVCGRDEFFWVYDAPTPTRTNLTVLPGTSASVRGITGDAGPLLKTEYAGDLAEWEQSVAAGIPSINTGISEMWYLDRVENMTNNIVLRESSFRVRVLFLYRY